MKTINIHNKYFLTIIYFNFNSLYQSKIRAEVSLNLFKNRFKLTLENMNTDDDDIFNERNTIHNIDNKN